MTTDAKRGEMGTCCTEVLNCQLQKRQIKRDVDVKELYLGESDLGDIDDLSQFKNLRYLWLNGNNLRVVNCLSKNFRLSELYLQNNALISVSGALSHLTTLTVLFLNNNQLRGLDTIVKEMDKMHCLATLNLFNNPLAQEAEYRQYVIHHVPSVQLLDRREVLKSERDSGSREYSQQEESVRETVAFGRRSEGPPSLYYPGGQAPLETTVPADFEVGNNFYRNNPVYANEQQAINARALKRSVNEYTSFDWSRVPTSDQKRTAAEPFTSPQIVTTRFR